MKMQKDFCQYWVSKMDWLKFFNSFFRSDKGINGQAHEGFAIMSAGGSCNIDKENLKNLCQDASFVLACDRGYDLLEKNGLAADLIIGDFDSSITLNNMDTRKKLTAEEKIRTYPERKNKTDSELGLDILYEKNIKNVVFIGGLGSRPDHSLVNLFFLKKYAMKGMNIVLLDQSYFVGYILPGSYNFEIPENIFEKPETINSKNTYVSFLALDEGLEISLEGFDYNLENTRLEPCSSLGVSNHIFKEDNEVRVKGKKGQGLFFLYSHEK